MPQLFQKHNAKGFFFTKLNKTCPFGSKRLKTSFFTIEFVDPTIDSNTYGSKSNIIKVNMLVIEHLVCQSTLNLTKGFYCFWCLIIKSR